MKVISPDEKILRARGLPRVAYVGKVSDGLVYLRTFRPSRWRADVIRRVVDDATISAKEVFDSLPDDVKSIYISDAEFFKIPVFQLFRKSDLLSRFSFSFGRFRFGISRFGF